MRRFSSGTAPAVAATLRVLLDVGGAADMLVSHRNLNQVLRNNGTTGARAGVLATGASGGLSSPAGLAFSAATERDAGAAAVTALLQYDGVTGDSIGSFAAAKVSNPAGMMFGRDGHLHVASRLDHRIARFDERP
jgi:hypothetical protein